MFGSQAPDVRVVKLPEGSHFRHTITAPNPEEANGAVQVTWQLGHASDLRLHCVAQVFGQVGGGEQGCEQLLRSSQTSASHNHLRPPLTSSSSPR
jgi:hypothetical protein